MPFIYSFFQKTKHTQKHREGDPHSHTHTYTHTSMFSCVCIRKLPSADHLSNQICCPETGNRWFYGRIGRSQRMTMKYSSNKRKDIKYTQRERERWWTFTPLSARPLHTLFPSYLLFISCKWAFKIETRIRDKWRIISWKCGRRGVGRGEVILGNWLVAVCWGHFHAPASQPSDDEFN